MIAQHGDGIAGDGDATLAGLRLGRLHTQAGLRLLQAALHADDPLGEIYVGPLQRPAKLLVFYVKEKGAPPTVLLEGGEK